MANMAWPHRVNAYNGIMVLQLWPYDVEQSENEVQCPSQILEPEPDTGPNALYIHSNPTVSQKHVGAHVCVPFTHRIASCRRSRAGEGEEKGKKERKTQNCPD